MSIAVRVTVFIKWLLVISLVVGLSDMMSQARMDEGEGEGIRTPLALTPKTIVREIGEASELPLPVLEKALNLQEPGRRDAQP